MANGIFFSYSAKFIKKIPKFCRVCHEFCNQLSVLQLQLSVPSSLPFRQVAYYGEPSMAPGTFLQAYVQATTEEFRESSHAPKIDAKNPAGESRSPISGRLICAVHLNGPITEAVIKQLEECRIVLRKCARQMCDMICVVNRLPFMCE